MKYSILILLFYSNVNFSVAQTKNDSLSKLSSELDSIVTQLINDAIKNKENVLIARLKTSIKYPPKLTVMHQVDSCSYLYRIEITETLTLGYIYIQDRATIKFGCSNKFLELEKYINDFVQESKDYQYKDIGYTIIGYVNQKFVYATGPNNYTNQWKSDKLYHLMKDFLAL
ncbi:MAG: hypothetical protein COA33_005730 [Fluviicola sp.]|nr:hypothetical protein [Fluviicola sp.]